MGYSPERINPGDKNHTLTKIIKVVSGDTPDTMEAVASLYKGVKTISTFLNDIKLLSRKKVTSQ